ncbi:MAG: hypothetical protein JNN07_28555 [Verrucomicrobiales bacterium]|nr:hypothetical protein [Verrucomicrobiales bacterium]
MSVNPKKTTRSNPIEEGLTSNPRSGVTSSSPFTPAQVESSHLDQARIARARQLLDQDGYPSEKILRSIAKHLAHNWADSGTGPVILSPPRS